GGEHGADRSEPLRGHRIVVPGGRCAMRSGGLAPDRVFDAGQQRRGRGVPTALLDRLAQLGVEVVGLCARRALVEVAGDLLPLLVVELTREQGVDLLECVLALRLEWVGSFSHGQVAGSGWGSASRRDTANSYNSFSSAFLPRWRRL